MKKSVISYGEQFLASESDEVRYRASLLREVLQTTDSFANEVVAIAAHADVKAEIAKMNEERKAMTTLDEKETPKEEESDGNISLGAAIEGEEAKEEAKEPKEPKEEAKEATEAKEPKEEPKEEEETAPVETVPAGGITQLSELLERLTEELLPVSAKAQKKVRIPEGLDLDTPLAPLELPQEIEPTATVTFVDAPLFSYVSAREEEGRVSERGRFKRSDITVMERRVTVARRPRRNSSIWTRRRRRRRARCRN